MDASHRTTEPCHNSITTASSVRRPRRRAEVEQDRTIDEPPKGIRRSAAGALRVARLPPLPISLHPPGQPLADVCPGTPGKQCLRHGDSIVVGLVGRSRQASNVSSFGMVSGRIVRRATRRKVRTTPLRDPERARRISVGFEIPAKPRIERGGRENPQTDTLRVEQGTSARRSHPLRAISDKGAVADDLDGGVERRVACNRARSTRREPLVAAADEVDGVPLFTCTRDQADATGTLGPRVLPSELLAGDGDRALDNDPHRHRRRKSGPERGQRQFRETISSAVAPTAT